MNNYNNIRDRISISTKVFENYRPLCEKALEELAENGIYTIELMETPEQFEMSNIHSMKHIFNACSSTGIKICGYHSQYIKFNNLDTTEKRMKRVDKCKRQIDTMHEGGGKIWGCHARAADETLEYCIGELLKYIEGSGILIVLENFSRMNIWIKERLEFMEKINHPQLGMLVDIGHVRDEVGNNPMTTPGEPFKILNSCKKYLFHLHLHGVVNGEDHFPPLAEGDCMQWDEIFETLFNIGYNGYFNFEVRSCHEKAIKLTSEMSKRIKQKE